MVDQNAYRIAQIGNALGHARRVRILKLLIASPKSGRSYGTLQNLIGIPDASLRHHLHVLVTAGLLMRARKGSRTEIRLSPGPAQQEIVALLGLLSNPIQAQRRSVPEYLPWQKPAPAHARQHLFAGQPAVNVGFKPESSVHPP
ncbi:MAG: helix-turn-helix transcriptional regulator [Alphaproteobacteria bacterium]|nr:helix-turn-helix transcriptional regulator [Alphaproteobacteria bacterium]